MSYSVVYVELPVAVSSKLEHHTVICYLTMRGESASAIYRQLAEVYGDAVTYDVVNRWCRSFLEGQTSLADDERSGRPSVITEDAINTVQSLIDGNWRITVAEIERYFNDVVCDPISHGTDDVVKVAVHEYFAKLDRNFFTDGILKLITRYEKSLAYGSICRKVAFRM